MTLETPLLPHISFDHVFFSKILRFDPILKKEEERKKIEKKRD
jgi:hypothetical protein